VKLVWYSVALLCAVMGSLATLRSLERLIFGGGDGSAAFQITSGLGLLFLAARAVRQARSLKKRRPARPAVTPAGESVPP
jgi:hypothetical protein